MNSDKPVPADSGEATPHPSDDADHIPILDEALDLPTELGEHEREVGSHKITLDDSTTTPSAPSDAENTLDHYGSPDTGKSPGVELNVNLGYADETEEYVENDDLAEMDEIQTLPLAEMVLDDSQDQLVSAEQKQQIATLEAIVFEGENPNAPAPKKHDHQEDTSGADAAEQGTVELSHEPLVPADLSTFATPPPISPPLTKPLPTKSENPFLPQHILDRLNQGKRNLVEEIAQSSAALDASTAILRTHARAERLTKPTYSDVKPQQHSFNRDKSSQQKQKLVDDLVEEYLPLIAAELRRRLRKLLDE